MSEMINARLGIPKSIFNPLIDVCFGMKPNKKAYKEKFFPRLLPPYCEFRNILDLGNMIIAGSLDWGNMIITGDDFREGKNLKDMLITNNSLLGYKPMMHSLDRQIWNIGISFDEFLRIEQICYSGQEIENLEKNRISAGIILGKILDDALAYSFWIFSKAAEGKRIGYVRDNNGHPDFGDYFHDMGIGRFIPQYYDLIPSFRF